MKLASTTSQPDMVVALVVARVEGLGSWTGWTLPGQRRCKWSSHLPVLKCTTLSSVRLQMTQAAPRLTRLMVLQSYLQASYLQTSAVGIWAAVAMPSAMLEAPP